MKRTVLWTTAAVVLLLVAFVGVRAEARGRHGWCSHGWHHAGPVGYLAHDLKLSDAQRMQIRALWHESRPTISAHVHEFLAENTEMNAIAAQENPDQSKVQEIADREAITVAALLVEKERLQSKMYLTVLNPEQRAKADELQRRWEFRMDHAADLLGPQSAEK